MGGVKCVLLYKLPKGALPVQKDVGESLPQGFASVILPTISTHTSTQAGSHALWLACTVLQLVVMYLRTMFSRVSEPDD